jgi:hypothetical protein
LNRNHLYIQSSYLLMLLFTIATALDFSKDTLTAFDGKLWNGNDDSVVVSNTSSSTKIIDSILIEIDNPVYYQFQIGWVEMRNDSTIIRIFNTDSLISSNCWWNSDKVITLNKYKISNIKDKITIKSNKKISIQSPYFSTSCSNVGIIVDCFYGPCHDINTKEMVTKFNGRIIFYSDHLPDTLHLNCHLITYVTSTKYSLTSNKKIIPQNHSSCFNILGRKISATTKLDAFHSFKKNDSKAATLLKVIEGH